MIVRDSQNGFTPTSRNGRRFTPTSRTRKNQVPLVHPSVADTLVEGVRVVFDDWTDDASLERAAVKRPEGARRPGAARWSPEEAAPKGVRTSTVPAGRVDLSYIGDDSLEPAPQRVASPREGIASPREGVASPRAAVAAQTVAASRRRLRIAAMMVGLFVTTTLFFALGGVGALFVAAATAALLLVPSGVDVVVVPAAPSLDAGRSDAELVVMPDPGFQGGTTLEPVRKPTR